MAAGTPDIEKLRRAMDKSRKSLKSARESRYEALRQYVGKHYSENGAADRVPINLIEMAVNVYCTHLAATRPKGAVTTTNMRLKPEAATLEVALNHSAEEMEIEESLYLAVLDSMFTMGILKVGEHPGARVELDGESFSLPDAYVDHVDFDDWVHDCSARKLEDAGFVGNRYRMPLDEARALDWFDHSEAKKLEPTRRSSYSRGEDGGEDRVEDLGRDDTPGRDDDEYEPYVELWDLYLPRLGKIVTMANQPDVGWLVPGRDLWPSPFHVLRPFPVPNNIMPLPPKALWMDLHLLANAMMRKLGRQAERQKTVELVRAGNEEDGRKIMTAKDGEVIPVTDPGSTREAKFGGIDPASFAFLLQLKDLFSYMGGNIDTLAGLSSGADTLGQDRLLVENASKRMQNMQARTMKFYKRVYEHLASLLWHNQFYDPMLVKQGPMGIRIPTRLRRIGRLSDYAIEIDPYSAQSSTPSSRLNALMMYFERIYPMVAQYSAENSGGVNIENLTRVYAKLQNIEADMAELIEVGEPTPPSDMDATRSNPVTNRIHTRVNRPGASRAGKDAALMSALLGMGKQSSEMAALTRSAG